LHNIKGESIIHSVSSLFFNIKDMKLTTQELADKLSKIELKVKEKKMQYYYIDHLNNTRVIKSELKPEEFLAKHNLKKSAIK